MIKIFEGLDKTGKTTIIKRLLESNASAKRKRICYKQDNTKLYSELSQLKDKELSLIFESAMLDLLAKNGLFDEADLLIDRFHASEFSYANTLRPKEFSTIADHFWNIDKQLATNDLLLFYFWKQNQITNLIEKGHEEHYTVSQLNQIENFYSEFLKRTFCDYYQMNTALDSSNSVEMKIDEIERIQQLREFNRTLYEKSDRRFNNAVEFPGFFRSNKTLIIGQNPGNPFSDDAHGNKLHHSITLTYNQFFPAYIINQKESKMYKWLALNFDITNISFTNLVKHSTKNNEFPTEDEVSAGLHSLTEQIALLKPKQIICLGQKTARVCEENGIRNILIQHPAVHNYSKRLW